jgi:hypothetical protein
MLLNGKTGVPGNPPPILADHLNLLITKPYGWSIYFGEDWSKQAFFQGALHK